MVRVSKCGQHFRYAKKLTWGDIMKKKLFSIIAMALAVTFAFSGCFNWLLPKQELTDAPLAAEKLIDFANGANPEILFGSDGWTNGDVFNVVWKDTNVFYENGIMRLGITEETATAWLNDVEVEFPYTAGEARTQNYYHYGDYIVKMKPSANPGTASTFFTCTGPYDTKFVLDANGDYVLDENGQRVTVENPHDEIDIEFLGDDTTHVQFNFFVGGVGGNEYMYDLGFDASEEFHEYGFRWAPDSITWFVDGEPVYKVTTDKTVKAGNNLRIVDTLPSTAGRILTNYWCGNERAEGWMGKYEGNVNDNGTEYQWIATSAEGAPLNPPEKPEIDDTEITWGEPVAPTFESTELYTVVTNGNSANVTYSAVGGSTYKPVEMDITEAAAVKNHVYLKVTNNGTAAVSVRVNVIDQALVDAGAQNMATNQSATQDGVAVNTDLLWGGSFFTIEAGQTSELIVKFSGEVEKLQLMLDSSRNDQNTYSGDVTVEELKFAKVGEIEIPEDPTDPEQPTEPKPADPVSGNLTLNFGGFETTIDGNVTDGYGINVDENNNIAVEYTNIVGNSYKNFWANVSAIAGNKNIFVMKVTNPGTASVKIRIDIESQTQVNANTTCCNLSATMDGNGVFTDLEWGGSVFEIPAGATAALEVTYDASKLPTNVKIMVDSCQWDDETSHEGKITISELAFAGEYIPEEGGEEGGDEPVAPPADTGLQFNFWTSSDNYTVNGNNIKYNGAGNAYSCAGTDIAALATGNNTFTVTITNNGAADSRVRVDIQATTQIGNHTVCNVSATGGDVWTDMEWGGSAVTVPAGQSVTLVITYDENTERGAVTNLVVFLDAGRGTADIYNSDITLSGMSFSKVGGEEPAPEAPVEGEYLSFKGNDCYTLSATPEQYVNSIQVTYTAVSDNTYQNVNTWIQDKAAGKATLGATIKNNGAETVNITVKLENGAGGACEEKVTLAAGESKTVSKSYDFAPDSLYFFIDSGWAETTATHAGDITISGIHFK